MLWHVYRSTVFSHNKSTSSSRVAEPHKKPWFTCWGSDRLPSPLPVALTLHFLWARARPSGVINNHSMEWGKVKIPLLHPKERNALPHPTPPSPFFFCMPNLINVLHGVSRFWEQSECFVSSALLYLPWLFLRSKSRWLNCCYNDVSR